MTSRDTTWPTLLGRLGGQLRRNGARERFA